MEEWHCFKRTTKLPGQPARSSKEQRIELVFGESQLKSVPSCQSCTFNAVTDFALTLKKENNECSTHRQRTEQDMDNRKKRQ